MGQVMNKKVLMRSAAIAVAGIAASLLGAQVLLQERIADTAQTPSAETISSTAARGLDIDNAQMTAFTADAGLNTSAPAPSASAGDECQPVLSVRATVDALIAVTLDAPCHPDTPLVISHADLAFSQRTDALGRYSGFIPALMPEARLDLFLGDDVFLEAQVTIGDLDDHIRIVAQWTGAIDLRLHGFHSGADFGAAGHLHAANPFDPDTEGAFLIALDENDSPDAMRAEIFSIPAQLAPASRAELALAFDSTLCGQTVSAYILTLGAGRMSDVAEARFTTPDCPADAGLLIMDLPLPAPNTIGAAIH
ncbi:MAG: hypothetical protein EA339_04660 [Rhodobacteraceae bacterium]|nr:MAG: hypothetical protein EA339_04660 [Paracoccaceae bacterium]